MINVDSKLTNAHKCVCFVLPAMKFSNLESCVAAGVNHQAWRRYDCLKKAVYVVCQQQPNV